METVAFTLKLRWLCWAMGAAVAMLALVDWRHPLAWPRKLHARLSPLAERRFPLYVCTLAASWFLLALAAKYTQLRTFSLNGQDFWLFEDMLRSTAEGAPFLTRYAPQALGFVQHGAIHGFFVLYFVLPIAYAIGTLATTLAFNPAALALAGAALAALARPRWGALNALLIALAFLLSHHAGTLLNYEMHPEVAYPLFAILWALFRDRPFMLFAVTLAGMGIKEDAFLVFLPLTLFAGNRKSVLASAAAVALGGGLQLFAIHQWSHGHWGPAQLNDLPVTVPEGLGFLHGQRWDSPASALKIAYTLLTENGALARIAAFLVSKPWLSLLALAPWILKRPRAWCALLPLAFAHALIGGQPAQLINYYSAPFVGLIWLEAADERRTGRALAWLFVAALLLGPGSLEWRVSSDAANRLREEARAARTCLEKLEGWTVAPSRLLGELPRAKVWTDRVPRDAADWERTRNVVFVPGLATYEMPPADVDALRARITSDSSWQMRCGSGLVEVYSR